MFSVQTDREIQTAGDSLLTQQKIFNGSRSNSLDEIVMVEMIHSV